MWRKTKFQIYVTHWLVCQRTNDPWITCRSRGHQRVQFTAHFFVTVSGLLVKCAGLNSIQIWKETVHFSSTIIYFFALIITSWVDWQPISKLFNEVLHTPKPKFYLQMCKARSREHHWVFRHLIHRNTVDQNNSYSTNWTSCLSLRSLKRNLKQRGKHNQR